MRALLYGGKRPDRPKVPAGHDSGAERRELSLMERLDRAPVELIDLDQPGPQFEDWVVIRTQLCGICGSDAKQVFNDFSPGNRNNALSNFVSMPQVLGHEVVGTIEQAGPAVQSLSPGQRVVLNPWLSCRPRGVDPVCPACEAGDFSLCWSFQDGRLSPGLHTGFAPEATGGYADFLPAHESMAVPVPAGVSDEDAVLADPFSVSLHAVMRNPPPPTGRAVVYGAGALGITATAILRSLFPEVEVLVIARWQAQADLAGRLGARVIGHEPALGVIEEIAKWSGGTLRSSRRGLPMAYPGGVDVVYNTVARPETMEVSARVLKARGLLVQSGLHGAAEWESSPLYFKELRLVGSNAFGMETVRDVKAYAYEHYFSLLAAGELSLQGMLTHTFDLTDWRAAFGALADQGSSGAIKVAFDFR
jgi:threonine dehydrogenase-like Zn-dependent dehydrogenase